MCASTAPNNVSTDDLFEYVNTSNCVLQQEDIELYVMSDWEAAMYGNYDILGKVMELRQSSNMQMFDNVTSFSKQPVCDIKVYHGYVQSITCDNRGVGYEDNLTQFDMLHDVMRYLLPRLQSRLFDGWDIPQQTLFGHSTMQRVYDDSSGHTIHRKYSKQSLLDERYKN